MRVASYSLYRHPSSAYEQPEAGAGRGRFFYGYLATLVRAHSSCFSGWQLWIHHDDRAPECDYWPVMLKLHEAGRLRLIPMGQAHTHIGSMLWRLCPVFEPGVTHVICRDIDSLPTPRERAAVERWVNSGKPIHAMHDSVSHRGTPLLGGMIGIHAPWFRDNVAKSWGEIVGRMRARGFDLNKHGSDQLWLNAEVWPLVKDFLCQYDTPETLGRPTEPRDICGGDARHVGGAYFAGLVAQWYDANYPDSDLFKIEQEALR